MKKTMLLSLGCILGLGLSLNSCATAKQEAQADSDGGSRENVIIGMANPFHDCETLEDAAVITGFTMTLPSQAELPEWASENSVIYRASDVNMKLLEIIYPSDENLTKEVRIRKAITEKEDTSGDYNNYDSEKEIEMAGKTVKAKLLGSKIALAIWVQDGYSYSVHVTDGLEEAAFERLIATIK